MHLIFVSYHSLASNSGGHILNLAKSLEKHGMGVTIFVPFDADAVQLSSESQNIRCIAFSDLHDWLRNPPEKEEKSLLVAWTPRENVRHFVERFRKLFKCRYVVHLEDNESLLAASQLGLENSELAQQSAKFLDRKIHFTSSISHPLHFPRFVSEANGATALIDTLFTITEPPEKHLVFWPGASEVFFESTEIDYNYRKSLGIHDKELVLSYTGNVHTANHSEVRSLYLATAILNRRGIKTRLIRTGNDFVSLFPEAISEIQKHVINLGRLRDDADVARVLSASDILVQPGRSDDFNDYRFPSKLPEFFATGRPVILPDTNLGRFVMDGQECLLLKRGDAVEIADQITRLRKDQQLRSHLSDSSRQFALKNFRWHEIALRILSFYKQIISTETL
jgi:glycosyltransferase involved in cell wall biosynthesis